MFSGSSMLQADVLVVFRLLHPSTTHLEIPPCLRHLPLNTAPFVHPSTTHIYFFFLPPWRCKVLVLEHTCHNLAWSSGLGIVLHVICSNKIGVKYHTYTLYTQCLIRKSD